MNPHVTRWRTRLDNEEAWYAHPSYEYDEAVTSADLLLDDGLVDRLEWFEMRELALAARDHYIEDSAGDLIRANRQFVLLDPDGAEAGQMDGFLLTLHNEYGRRMVRRCREGLYVIEPSLGYVIARIVGDEMRFITGRRLRIVHVSTRVNGVVVSEMDQ